MQQYNGAPWCDEKALKKGARSPVQNKTKGSQEGSKAKLLGAREFSRKSNKYGFSVAATVSSDGGQTDNPAWRSLGGRGGHVVRKEPARWLPCTRVLFCSQGLETRRAFMAEALPLGKLCVDGTYIMHFPRQDNLDSRCVSRKTEFSSGLGIRPCLLVQASRKKAVFFSACVIAHGSLQFWLVSQTLYPMGEGSASRRWWSND